MLKRSACILFIAFFMLLVGCNMARNEKFINTQPAELVVEESRNLIELEKALINDSIADSDVTSEAIPIIYSKNINATELPIIYLTEEINPIIKQPIEDTVIVIYSLGEQLQLYAYLEHEHQSYDLGPIGYGKANNRDFQYTVVEALSSSWIKVSGSLGANAPHTLYLDITKEKPTGLTISAYTKEFDVNGDGSNEIVASVGSPTYTSLYTLNDQQIGVIEFNDLLDAFFVRYDDIQNNFVVQFEINQPISRWELDNNYLIQIKEE
ncbi:hypothetical protein [Paenibacillus endoradicis]|uniref:hypothetical protein n=1 Tax=Paenibacillus endoradicis TaxID=2972487 RepID=UPI0021596D21|nr:hypothetical protein [Paenibacillus endoradicis]MCR8657402.1 hypothetical protein [Paenibacillus endoradicis]